MVLKDDHGKLKNKCWLRFKKRCVLRKMKGKKILSFLTHSFLYKNLCNNLLINFPYQLLPCLPLSIFFTTECADLVEIRKKYFEERSLHSLFQNTIQQAIFDFLREIGVFYQIRSVLK